MWIIFIFIWIICGGICYFLAKEKEKDKWSAFCWGCLFGIWAIIYYLFCRKGGVPCKFCRETISKKATVCPHCHKEVAK